MSRIALVLGAVVPIPTDCEFAVTNDDKAIKRYKSFFIYFSLELVNLG